MFKWLSKFFKGFSYAGRGVLLAFEGRNMRVHGLAFLIAVAAGWYFQIAAWEWIAILLISGAVMSAEIANTALEDVCNTMRDTLHVPYEGSRAARDMAAGAVLVLAVMAAVIAGIIFIPRILALLA